ncbi:UNVERIFIED_ORG: hypothetical protein L601_000800000340 [Gordonia westfalica J30]
MPRKRMSEVEAELRRHLKSDRELIASLVSEVRDLREEAWPRPVGSTSNGKRVYSEPPEFSTIRFFKDRFRFVAVRVDDIWYTSSQLDRYVTDATELDYEPVFQLETWERICEVADRIELATEWRALE